MNYPIANGPLSTHLVFQGGCWAGCDGISVLDQNPPVCDTPGALWSSCFLVFLGPPGPFGIFLSRWQWKYFVDLCLVVVAAVFADAFSIDPLSFVEQPKQVGKEFFRGSVLLMSTWKEIVSNIAQKSIRELPDHFQSDQKHEKQPEVHGSALLKAKCQLLKVLTRSRGPKRPDLAGEITEKSLALKSEKTFS